MFSSFAFNSSGKLFPSNTTPMCSFVSLSSVVEPSISTTPLSFSVKSSMAFIVVDFPAPFSPISPTILPHGTLNDTSLSSKSSYFFFFFSILIP